MGKPRAVWEGLVQPDFPSHFLEAEGAPWPGQALPIKADMMHRMDKDNLWGSSAFDLRVGAGGTRSHKEA